ncbi:hypothetical protein [Burkholderia plantarii]|uniref:hypothetical protein n=1 Tax=Burkholderia plantarii TaxID=41899 RepID=UPI0011DFD9B2|nr:hypothetical protein [Burkholderia plantarii]GLZ22060.1 hypothetical protein Bpla01_55890 [Burkholderia plantarii]
MNAAFAGMGAPGFARFECGPLDEGHQVDTEADRAGNRFDVRGSLPGVAQRHAFMTGDPPSRRPAEATRATGFG